MIMENMTNKNIVVYGKGGIRVEVVLHSQSSVTGKELITMLVDHPRIVHAEELKHRQFSFSAASSRAIPSAKMAEQLTGMPVSFGKNQSGMQAGEEHDAKVKIFGKNGYYNYYSPSTAWKLACESAQEFSNAFAEAGYHKQVYNRLTEPFQMIRVLVSATETDNFYWLRDDKAADPTLAEQARCMREAHMLSTPQILKPGQWHLPFVDSFFDDISGQHFYIDGGERIGVTQVLSLDEAIKVSCARCAATSFRNENYGLEKSLQVYDRLVNGDKVHAGALEHCGTPMEETTIGKSFMDERWWPDLSNSVNVRKESATWQQGISHMDRDGNLWSGNYCGFIQYRKLVPNECYTKPK